MNRSAFLLAALAISGCASNQQMTTGSIPAAPVDYRAQVANRVMSDFKDPGSIQNAKIAAPKLDMNPLPLPSGLWSSGHWVVCMSANSKNSFGGYTGQQSLAAVFIDGKVEGLIGNARWTAFCADAQYEAFAEVMPGSDRT